MMNEMTREMEGYFNKMDDRKKIRMFYELGKYFLNTSEEFDDPDMENLFDDIAAVINDIENL